jgi:hypothetical protein
MVLARRILLLVLFTGVAPAWAAIPAEQDDCLGCHGDPSSVSPIDLPSGEKLDVFVDVEVFAKSVHGGDLRCTDCHADKKDYPHDTKPFQTRRDVTVAYYEQCKSCHFDTYTKALDGVHYAELAKGNHKAALCVDCHGFHDISKAAEPRAKISATCAHCHAKENEVFAKSVHGAALAKGSADVPVCTDCHRAHDIVDPRNGKFVLDTPQICGRCHTNPQMMDKYGLSTKVVDTYLADFHGMSATLQKRNSPDDARLAATCTDCHGVHDIASSKDPSSTTMQANLVKTCQKCHADANENFPKSWMSHYEPSWEKASAVYMVQLFYKVLIPFMIGGLVLQIALHVWRIVVNR